MASSTPAVLGTVARPGGTTPASEASLIELHGRVLRGDEEALNEVAGYLLKALPREIRPRFPRMPDDWINDAVEDSILDYRRHPDRFDSTRQVPLKRFLMPAAIRNLLNRLERERRHLLLESEYLAQRPPGVPPGDLAREDQFRESILAVAADDAERAAIVVLLDHPRDLGSIARALGLSARPVTEQRRECKRFRDRIIKRSPAPLASI